MNAAEQLDEWLARPMAMIAAFCPKCGGWTMVVTTESKNARDWVQMCYVAGDLIMPVRTTDSLGGASCPQVDILLDDRTCDQ